MSTYNKQKIERRKEEILETRKPKRIMATTTCEHKWRTLDSDALPLGCNMPAIRKFILILM
jgi:hypothetical protein